MNESQVLGENLKRIRTEQGLSLGQLAEKSGVSKMVLSQIERGDSNPTLSTIWKVAVGLNVPYTNLLESHSPAAQVLHRSTVPSGAEVDGTYTSYIYYNYGDSCPFDLFVVEVEPGSSKESMHNARSTEYIYIEQGSLELKFGNTTVSLISGDSIKFDSSEKHQYTNLGKELLRFVSIITY